MGLFSKMGNKGMATVIECNVEDGLLVKKCETEDFFTGTQLIVHESQQALFFMNGKALDVFANAGKYTLETQSLPMLTSILNLPLKGKNQFRAELYFINCAEQMGIRWGTDTPFTYIDRTSGIPFEVGARGEMSLKVKDARRFITKLVGTSRTMDREKTVEYFEAFVKSRVSSHFPQVLENNNVSVFEVDKYITVCSDQLQELLKDDLETYGLDLPMFRVVGFNKPVDDPNYQEILKLRGAKVTELGRESLEAEKAAIRQNVAYRAVVTDAQAQATKRQVEGYDYATEQAYEVAKRMAENSAAGGMANMGVGLGAMGGMAAGVGPAMAGFAAGAIAPIAANAFGKNKQNPVAQTSPAAGMPNQLELRKNTPSSNGNAGGGLSIDEMKARFDMLKQAKDSGIMTEEEFEIERKKLIERITK